VSRYWAFGFRTSLDKISISFFLSCVESQNQIEYEAKNKINLFFGDRLENSFQKKNVLLFFRSDIAFALRCAEETFSESHLWED
jgi:hypothetical protein